MTEKTLRALGLDLGNSITNAVAGWTESLENWVDVPTAVARVENWTPANDAKPDEALFLRIKSAAVEGEHSWLVGKALATETDIPPSAPGKNAIKVDTESLFVTGLAAIGLLIFRRYRSEIKGGRITVRVSMMAASVPWGQHSDYAKATMSEKLVGTHELVFAHLPGFGELAITLMVEKVVTSPEGVPALMALAYLIGPGDVLKAARPELVRSIIGLLDAGGGTTDILLFNPKFNLVRGSCDTLSHGINDALKRALKELHNDRWEQRFPNVTALVDHIRRGEWEVPGHSGPMNLHKYLDPELKPIANVISQEIRQRWGEAVSHFFLVGGGAVVLADLLSLPAGRKPEVPENPEWMNAKGNYIVARLALGERAAQ